MNTIPIKDPQTITAHYFMQLEGLFIYIVLVQIYVFIFT